MPKLDRPDASIHYEIVGQGAPLLMIAGLASDGASWGPIVEDLSVNYQLILIDNRGCGQTQYNGEIDPKAWVDDALALMNHLKIEKFSAVGHSLGGAIAYRLAMQNPDRIDALITLAAADVPPAKARALTDSFVRLRQAGVSDKMWLELFFQFLFAPPFFDDPRNVQNGVNASLSYLHAQSKQDFYKQVDAADRMHPISMADFEVPTLAITGEKDILIPPEAVEDALKDHPHSTTLQILGAGHSIHWDKPKETINAINMYLSD